MADELDTTSAGDGKNTEQAAPAATPPAPAEEKKFTQADMDAAIKQRLTREREQAKKEREQAEAAAAEAQRVKNGEWETLANDRGKRLEELEPAHTTLAERHAALVAVVQEEIKERAKLLPDSLKKLLPKGDDVLAQRTALADLEKAAAELGATRSPGTPAGPRGSGASQFVGDTVAQVAAKRQQLSGDF